MLRFRLPAALLLTLLLALGLVACGGSDSDESNSAASPIADGAIEVDMKDTMKFDPDTVTVKAGEDVVLVVKNTGAIPHNLTIEASDVDVTLDGKKSQTVEFTAPSDPGEYEIVCHEPGHENAGMVGTLVVER